MIKAQPFALNYTSNPNFTLQASTLGLSTFAACAIENRGPGACLIFPSGTPQGPPIEIIGANQRKYVMLGNVDTVCCALAAPVSNLFLTLGFQLYAAIALCDDYSLAGTPDYRRGNFGTFLNTSGITGSAAVAATDAGFDRIRGIYLPPQISPPTIEVTDSTDSVSFPLITTAGASIGLTVPAILVANFAPGAQIIISDEPIVAGVAGGGTYG